MAPLETTLEPPGGGLPSAKGAEGAAAPKAPRENFGEVRGAEGAAENFEGVSLYRPPHNVGRPISGESEGASRGAGFSADGARTPPPRHRAITGGA